MLALADGYAQSLRYFLLGFSTVAVNLVMILACSPPVNPPKEISDPNDKKPADWDDRERSVACSTFIALGNPN